MVPPILNFPGGKRLPQVPKHIIQEQRSFLCRHGRRRIKKAEQQEVNERWMVITDVVRYLLLMVAWFWFSAQVGAGASGLRAQVMDMACLEGGVEGLRRGFRHVAA